MNIAVNPNREAIYAQIDRGVFTDALEYSQFGKEVFGKDFSIINMSKLNKSLYQNNSKINDSLSKLNSLKVESLADKGNRLEVVIESEPGKTNMTDDMKVGCEADKGYISKTVIAESGLIM